MDGIISLFKGDFLRKKKSTLLMMLGLTAFVFVACTSGTAATGQPVSNPDTEISSEKSSEDTAPDFELTLFGTGTREKGETLKMSDLRGQPVVLNFWFPSCPPCVAEMPDHPLIVDFRSKRFGRR